MRVLVAGGGTGGHVIPALAIALELKTLYNAEIVFIGTARGIETRLVPAAGFDLELIAVGALNRVDFATKLKTLLDLPRALLQATRIIANFRPDVMIGVGGYASGPAMLAGGLMNLPMLAFEPNLVPGIANRLAAPMVRAAAVHFAATRRYFRNAIVTGVPVRREFFQFPARSPDAPPTLLVFGGSQGAHAINMAVAESFPLLARTVPGIHVIHQTGERDLPEVELAVAASGISADVSAFIDDMPAAFARADLLLCRSGAGTVAEVAAAGKPAIFVPLPTAADDHQRRNAEPLADAGAAHLLPQSELTSERLVRDVASLFRDPRQLAAMSTATRHFAHPDAASQIARLTVRIAGAATAQDVA
jgi:UDP-N-acetylglucosamine--N-acetylmuramyl-(pentapeptide) pyrophosphoryl-undecaprenol N-acetylglucosamine transferase